MPLAEREHLSLVLLYEVLAVSTNENKDTKSKFFLKKVCTRAAASWVSKNVVSFSLRGAGPGPDCSPYNVRERFAASVLLMFTVCFLLNIGFKGFYMLLVLTQFAGKDTNKCWNRQANAGKKYRDIKPTVCFRVESLAVCKKISNFAA